MEKTRVLFICFGNACRSAMAEKIANHLFPEIFIADSAGTIDEGVISFVDMDFETIEVMGNIGITIGGHRPKHVGIVTESFDTVINMSPENRRYILAYCPQLASAEWVDWKVRDPRGRPLIVYQEVRDDLLERIRNLATFKGGKP